MNRVRMAFQGKKVFIPFVTAGYPDFDTCVNLILLLAEEGAGLIEIGVPFSDPIADGKVIQASSQKALEAGMTIDKVFELVEKVRKRTQVPLVLMTYYNIVLAKGVAAFVKSAQQCGVDGLIVPDLVAEEADELAAACRGKLALTFFVCSTTDPARIPKIVQKTTGFLYYVSRLGVTGTGGLDLSGVKERLKMVKKETVVPVALGFGVSQPKECRELFAVADGVIVGSALIQQIDSSSARDENFDNKMRAFVRPFVEAASARDMR